MTLPAVGLTEHRGRPAATDKDGDEASAFAAGQHALFAPGVRPDRRRSRALCRIARRPIQSIAHRPYPRTRDGRSDEPFRESQVRMTAIRKPYLLFLGDAQDRLAAKTAIGVYD